MGENSPPLSGKIGPNKKLYKIGPRVFVLRKIFSVSPPLPRTSLPLPYMEFFEFFR